MAGEPELKTATRQRIINPLFLAWGFVLVLIGLAVGWIFLSDDIEQPAEVQDTASAAPPTTAETSSMPETAVEANSVPANLPNTEANEIITSTEVAAPIVVPKPSNIGLSASQKPLSPAPNDNLLVRGDNGLKPALGPDGLIAWKEYARPFTGSDDAPRIAIMITDIGLSTKNSTAAIDNLPGEIDLAFSPYGRNLQSWMDKARMKGHEGFLMIPTEPLNYPDNDPGPHTLIADFSERDNLIRLDWILSQVAGYVGVVNHMGSKFTASEEALEPIITDLNSRGLMLVDSRSTRFSMAARIARRMGMPRAMNDRFIDNVTSSDEIRRQLGELEKTANTFGAALGLARATPLTINEIADWTITLEQKGIELVPVSALANRQPIK